MAGSDLNVKFTNEKYMTRMDVAKSLGTNLIDQIWREIIVYRRGMSVELPIFDNARFHFNLTQTPKVVNLIAELSGRVSRCENLFDKLMNGSIAKYTLTHDMLKSALKCVAKFNGIDVSEITLQNIIEHKCNDLSYQVIINYFNALERLSKASYEQFGEEFLANYYAILKGQEELTSFYRVNDTNSPSARFLVGAEYNNGVQAHLIEEMMNSVISYANDRNQPLLNRLISTIFMFNYIKPFEDFNLEMSLISAKAILSSSGLSIASVYVPLELILNDKNLFGDISREVLKSHDFTYAFLKGSDSIFASFDAIIDRIIQVNARALEATITMGDNAKKFKEEFGIEPSKDVFEEARPQPAPAPAPVVAPKPVPAPSPAPSPAPATHVAEPKPFDNRPTSDLSEKELKARELDILESDPYIKKGQAHFYVRHCTKGKFYTIQEYKRFEGCVYETARTSMDNLALRGYYRREQIKNKFVYTPIDK